MTVDPIRVYSRSGRLFYVPHDDAVASACCELGAPRLFRERRRRPHSIEIRSLPNNLAFLDQVAQANLPRRRSITEKLATSRSNAKRFLRSVISSTAAATASDPAGPATAGSRPAREPTSMFSDEPRANGAAPSAGAPASAAPTRPSLGADVRTSSGQSAESAGSSDSGSSRRIAEEKPVALGNGISAFITLAEPVLFLQGFEQGDIHSRTTAMLRGSLVVKVAKAAKIKTITLTFRGKARTEWPEGIPPRKVEYFEEQTINRHTWPFFNAQFPTAESGHCADYCKLAKGGGNGAASLLVPSSGRLAFDQFARSVSPRQELLSAKDQKRLSLQNNASGSFGKGESSGSGTTIAQRGYRTFHPGDYIYNFELPLDSHLPETIDVDLGTVRYELEAMIERAGAFRPNLLGTKEVTLIRAPSESSLETVEPIAISRNWEDQLHYDIVISGKSFPLGAQVPIAFKLTPLAKVQCHRIKVFVTENIEYHCSNKTVRRLEPIRKIQLFEKRADGPSTSTFPGSSVRILSGGGVDFDSREAAAQGNEFVRRDMTNLLGNLDGEHNVGPTEMEFSVQLPSCASMKDKDRTQQLHFDTTYSNIQVHHWIKIVMRLSKPDENDSSRRRHFEISIDSPFHVLSCQATQANVALPAYSGPPDGGSNADAGFYECGCPGAPRRRQQTSSYMNPGGAVRSSSARRAGDGDGPAPPPTAHLDVPRAGPVQRPIHLLRTPSFNPPAFDAEQPPPPLVTPPPQYDSIVGEGEGLADYFARLADEMGDEDDSRGRGRIDLPLTPGGRVNRSMDERRTWAPLGHVG
ncbi:MAG: hypothetical protein M1832_004239 [Thelocarpon impressellum]|nr:MAG: hypothetical protein M1832_004239 [Thelocarpon impressellum]